MVSYMNHAHFLYHTLPPPFLIIILFIPLTCKPVCTLCGMHVTCVHINGISCIKLASTMLVWFQTLLLDNREREREKREEGSEQMGHPSTWQRNLI